MTWGQLLSAAYHQLRGAGGGEEKIRGGFYGNRVSGADLSMHLPDRRAGPVDFADYQLQHGSNNDNARAHCTNDSTNWNVRGSVQPDGSRFKTSVGIYLQTCTCGAVTHRARSQLAPPSVVQGCTADNLVHRTDLQAPDDVITCLLLTPDFNKSTRDRPTACTRGKMLTNSVRCVLTRGLPCARGAARRTAPPPRLGLRWHCDELPKPDAAKVSLVYVDTKSGKRTSVTCLEGENLLHVAHKNAIDLEGACECSLACSTCHVVLTPAAYDLLDEPSDAENDLLDLAYGLTST